MSVQAIDGDAKPERAGKAVLSAATKIQSGIVNVACSQPATRDWKGSGNPCPASQDMNRRAHRVAAPERKRRTEQVAEHIGGMSTIEDVRSMRVTEIQFSPNALGAVSGKADIYSRQRDAT